MVTVKAGTQNRTRMKITNGLEVLSCDQQMHMVLNTATSYRIREVLTVVETITCR